MPKTCDKCDKGPKSKVSRSHALNKTKKIQYPNLQTKRVDGKKFTLCARCIKTMNKA